MSYAYSTRKKAIKRQLDKANPERNRIRGLIRRGLLPRYFFLKVALQERGNTNDQSMKQRPTFGKAYYLSQKVAGIMPGTWRTIKIIFMTHGTLAIRSTFRQLTSASDFNVMKVSCQGN